MNSKKYKPRGRGRPVTTGTTPARQLGRLDEKRWERLQNAATSQGLSFSEWAIKTLEKAAQKIS